MKLLLGFVSLIRCLLRGFMFVAFTRVSFVVLLVYIWISAASGFCFVGVLLIGCFAVFDLNKVCCVLISMNLGV